MAVLDPSYDKTPFVMASPHWMDTHTKGHLLQPLMAFVLTSCR
jgi:hypothetical protein